MQESNIMACFPTLWVRDIHASVKWYEKVADFSVTFVMPGAGNRPALVHLRRAPHQDLILIPDPPGFSATPQARGQGVTLTFIIDEDLNNLANTALASGGKVVSHPADPSRGTREIIITDPDGYRLIFAKRVPS